MQKAAGIQVGQNHSSGSGLLNLSELKEPLMLRDLERIVRQRYIEYIRSTSSSDAEASKKLGLAPPNYHRMCKELGIK
jgi:hypothetical protein